MNNTSYPVLNENGKRAVLYLRVSTEEQVDNFSLETQENICRKEAEKRGFSVVDIFREEGRSAKSIIGRPVLIQLLEYCRKNKNKIQAVFVYRLDRISRITADYLAIRKKLAENGVTIISSTEPTGDSPTEKLVETILAGFAQLDNDIRSERAKNGLKARFMSGMVVTGSVPLGYKVTAGYAVADPETWDLMKKAWDLMATGTKSLEEMAKIMTEWGLKERYGKRKFFLRATRVNVLFRNKFYMGILSSKTYKEHVKGQYVPMITESQYYQVQAILDGRNVNKVALAKRVHTNPDFPLRRIVRCGKCGQGLTGGWSKGRHTRYGYYRCSSDCTSTSIKIDDLDKSIMGLLKEITPKPETLNLFLTFLNKTFHERLNRLNKVKSLEDQEIQKIKELRKVLVEKNMTGVYSDEIFKEQNALLEDRMIRAHVVKDDSAFERYTIEEVTTFIRTLLTDLGATYKRSNIQQIKVLFGSIFPLGVAWNYDGTLNRSISPIYQSINTLNENTIFTSADERT
jgi:site-specific DNA recombinase